MLVALLGHDRLVLTTKRVAAVRDQPDVERVLEHVPHRERAEDLVPSAGPEALGVQPASDLTHRCAIRAPLEGDLHCPALAGIGLRHTTRALCYVTKRHRSDGQAALRAFALTLADVHGELVREELGDAADHGEHEPPGRRREVDVLGNAREADVRLAEALERDPLDPDVTGPAIDRVHDDDIELPARGALKQCRQPGTVLDLLGAGADALVRIDVDEFEALTLAVPRDLPSLRMQRVTVDLFLRRDTHIPGRPLAFRHPAPVAHPLGPSVAPGPPARRPHTPGTGILRPAEMVPRLGREREGPPAGVSLGDQVTPAAGSPPASPGLSSPWSW
ncbi:MAG: hypothetical protein OXC94_05795 [Chloroflexi bacterium]|nr:hypothetical protein [Chloroflexota bacterium]